MQRSQWNTQRALAISIFVDILPLSCLSVHSFLVKSVLPIVISSFFRKFVSWGQSYSECSLVSSELLQTGQSGFTRLPSLSLLNLLSVFLMDVIL